MLLTLCLTAILSAIVASVGPDSAMSGQPELTVTGVGVDAEIMRRVSADVGSGVKTIRRSFGRPFPAPFVVEVISDRKRFAETLRQKMGIAEPQRWMVAAGASQGVILLSPASWTRDADEHSGEDRRHVREVITHELVHVFHAQLNPSRDFEGMDDVGWFIEGIAAYLSGQLDREHRHDAEKAISEGKAPNRVSDAWSGKYRYGVSGSMVRFVDRKYGRGMLTRLLKAVTNEEAIRLLGTTETDFLDSWRASVTSQQSGRSRALAADPGLYCP